MPMKSALPESTFDVIPLTGGVGAEILNIDLAAPHSDSVWDKIYNTFVQYGVIFFRDQKLTEQQQYDFTLRFGKSGGKMPLVSSIDGYEDITEVRKDPEDLYNTGNRWHTDTSSWQFPVRGSTLLAREVPTFGGDTCFISMANAYDALSDGLKRTLEGLRAFHTDAGFLERIEAGSDLARTYVPGAVPEAFHPVVIRLPENGRKSLYVNPSKTRYFENWTKEESEPVLKFLYQHAQRPEFICRFRWRAGSIAVWDNYQTWHYAVNDYHGQRRVMHRTTFMSEPFTAASDPFVSRVPERARSSV